MITVDPGVTYFAWAVWREGVLDACGLWTEGSAWPTGTGRVIVECPDRRWRGTEKDVLDLARQAGFYAGRLWTGFPEEFVTPQQWKGQVPKKVHHPRITAALMPHERGVLPKKKGALVHVLDAVGIGLWKLGRRV